MHNGKCDRSAGHKFRMQTFLQQIRLFLFVYVRFDFLNVHNRKGQALAFIREVLSLSVCELLVCFVRCIPNFISIFGGLQCVRNVFFLFCPFFR